MTTTPRRRRITPQDFDNSPEEVEEERPAPRRRRLSAPDPAPKADVARNDDDDDDVYDEEDDVYEKEPTAPAPLPRRRLKAADDVEDEGDEESAFDDSLISRGWKASKARRQTGNWTNDFRFEEDPKVIKFLTEEPWSYSQHWVQRKGKQGFPCLGKSCPLCKIGVKSSAKYVWAVLDLGDGSEEPTVVNLQVGQRLFDALADFNDDPKVGPLTRNFWSMSKSGKGLKTTYTALPVKERDLDDDWGIDPTEVAAAVAGAVVPGPKEAITWYNADALKEIASEIME